MSVFFKYFGFQVGDNLRKRKFWKEVLNKVRKKLSKWKGKNLIFAGRVCLIKSVFTIVPLYYISIFKAPMEVCKDLTRL